MRPTILVCAGLVAVSVLATAKAQSCDPAAAMEAMVAAARANDAHAFAAYFPRGHAVLLTSTIETPPMSEWVETKDLVSDFAARGPYYGLLFHDADLDSFAVVFAATGFGTWRTDVAGRFLPPGTAYDDGRTFVRFACTADGPVIVELGWPSS